MFSDLQEAFLITLGPFLQEVLLPLIVAGGLVLGLLAPLIRIYKKW